MKLSGFLVFPLGDKSEVKGWLVWLLGAGRCNGVRPFFRGLGNIGSFRLLSLPLNDFLYAFVFGVSRWHFE